MKVGIIGSGGREHAICQSLKNSDKISKIFCFPGNAGTANIAENIILDLDNFENIKNFIKDQLKGTEPSFNKIAFENIYPLYGQIDIKGSSDARNWATQQDLTLQLNSVKGILESASKFEELPIYEQYIYQIDEFLIGLDSHFQVDSEHQISGFIKDDIELVLKHF